MPIEVAFCQARQVDGAIAGHSDRLGLLKGGRAEQPAPGPSRSRVVIQDGAHSAGRGEHGPIGGIAQGDCEPFVLFDGAIALHRDGDQLAHLSRQEAEGATGQHSCDEIRAVGGIQATAAHLPGDAVADGGVEGTGHREGEGAAAGMPLQLAASSGRDGQVGRWGDVVVEDRAIGRRCVKGRPIGGIGEADGEGLVGFLAEVALHVDRDQFVHLAGKEGDAATG